MFIHGKNKITSDAALSPKDGINITSCDNKAHFGTNSIAEERDYFVISDR